MTLLRFLSVFQAKTWLTLVMRGSTNLLLLGRVFRRDGTSTAKFESTCRTHPFPGKTGHVFARRWGSTRLLTPEDGAFLISGLGRFGNGIQQFVHAVSLANATGVQNLLFFPNAHTKVTKSLAVGKIELRPLRNPFEGSGRDTGWIWRSDFFLSGQQVHQFDPEAATLARPALRDLFRQYVDDTPAPGDVLTIHLRSGDIFGPRPHPEYGQPPFAFYQAIIDSRKWSEIVVVAEDNQNPCVRAIVDYGQSHGLSIRQTGSDFGAATRELSRSTHLVASRGTFVPGVVYLSEVEKTIYEFESEIDRIPSNVIHSYKTFFDQSGEYTAALLSHNWANTPSQKTMMVDYPKRLIGVKK